MRTLTATIFLLPTILVGGLCAAAVEPRKPSELVTIRGSASGAPCLGSERKVDAIAFNDGTSGVLEIPLGQVLVVTSADWHSGQGEPNRHHRLEIIRRDASGSPQVLVIGPGAQADDVGYVSGSLELPTGLVFKPGFSICASIRNIVSATTGAVAVHGFFAKDK
jgi:hypothetical protein